MRVRKSGARSADAAIGEGGGVRGLGFLLVLLEVDKGPIPMKVVAPEMLPNQNSGKIFLPEP